MSTTKERLKKIISDSKTRQEEKSFKDTLEFVKLKANTEATLEAIKSLEFMDKETVSAFLELLENHSLEIELGKSKQNSSDKDVSEINSFINSLGDAFMEKSVVVFSPSHSKSKIPACEHIQNTNPWDNSFFELTKKEMSSDGNYLCECPDNYPERAFDKEEQTKHIGCSLKSCRYDGSQEVDVSLRNEYKLTYYGETCIIDAPEF